MPGTTAHSVGVDIAQDTLEVHLRPAGSGRRIAAIDAALHARLALAPALLARFAILVSLPAAARRRRSRG